MFLAVGTGLNAGVRPEHWDGDREHEEDGEGGAGGGGEGGAELAGDVADPEGADRVGADAGGEDAHGSAAGPLGGGEEDEGGLHRAEAGHGDADGELDRQ